LIRCGEHLRLKCMHALLVPHSGTSVNLIYCAGRRPRVWRSSQRPLSREHLLQATRVHEDVFDRSIDVQILRLRRKLERDPSAPRVIQTQRGIGCVFAVPAERV
jgi:hypothetical protein